VVDAGPYRDRRVDAPSGGARALTGAVAGVSGRIRGTTVASSGAAPGTFEGNGRPRRELSP
jgi:hypothetical protein